MRIEDAYAANGEAIWHYFKDPKARPCPRGIKVQLLTRGFTTVTGEYTNEVDYHAWAPVIKRDKALEERLGIS
jgi:hypothetical protein